MISDQVQGTEESASHHRLSLSSVTLDEMNQPNSGVVYIVTGPVEFYLHDQDNNSPQSLYGLKRQAFEQFRTTCR